MPSHHTPAPARAIAGRRLAWFFAIVPILFAIFVIAFVPEGERESSALDTLPVGADSTLAVELEEQLPDDEGQVAIVLWTAESGELDQATQDELTKQGTALLSQSAEQAEGRTRAHRTARPASRAGPGRLRGRVPGRTARWRRGAAVPVVVSEDKTAAIVAVPVVSASNTDNIDKVEELRDQLRDDAPDGVEVQVTGPAAIQADIGAGLRRGRHPAARRDGRGRGDPADHHLPQPGAVAGAADGRRCRRPVRRDRVDQRARGRQRGVGRVDRRHPQRARLRRRHRLRPVADLALPRRAQDHRVTPRGDGARAAAGPSRRCSRAPRRSCSACSPCCSRRSRPPGGWASPVPSAW